MFKNGLAMAIKAQGTPLKEHEDGTVKMPFGTQYTVALHNYTKLDALINLYIDGELVFKNILLHAGTNTNIRRGEEKDRAFLFVPVESRTTMPQGKNDLLLSQVRVDYKFARPEPPLMQYSVGWQPRRMQVNYGTEITCSSSSAGMTVSGGATGQQVASVPHDIGLEFEPLMHFMEIKLRGNDSPITTKTTQYCTECGKPVKTKFCGACGTKSEVDASCIDCKIALERGSRYCPTCGRKITKA